MAGSVVGSNAAVAVAGFARGRALEKKAFKAGRYPRPLQKFYDSKKQVTQFTGNEVLVPIKERAVNVTFQKWSGSTSMQAPVQMRPGMLASFSPSNIFSAYFWPFDTLRKEIGVTILPNDNGKDAMGRAVARDKAGELILYQRMAEDMESFMDRMSELRDLEVHRQGATADDLVGLNAQLPIANTGNWGGLNRGMIPDIQHVVFAGNDANGTAPAWMGQRGIVGAGSNFIQQLEEFFRQLRAAAATCGLPKGRWNCYAGKNFLKYFKQQLRLEKIQFNVDSSSTSETVNVLLSDDRLGLGAPDISLEWDPTLDNMDIVAASEVGVGPSQLTATFSGGGATRQASGVVYVSAAGAVTDLAVGDSGEGYTSAPTVALGNVGGGTGASITVTVYSASSGAGLTQVAADDVRIGRIATRTIAAAGTGYPTTGIAAPFSQRMYALYEPAWTYLVQDGLDEYMSVPADNARERRLENQYDHTHCLVNKCPRVNGVFVASLT